MRLRRDKAEAIDYDVKIGIWGGSSSGKTCFLAALTYPPIQYGSDDGGVSDGWNVVGDNPEALDQLSAYRDILRRGQWPDLGTRATTEYRFRVTGKVPRRGMRLGQDDVELTICAEDRPGRDFLGLSSEGLWKELASCDGLVFLFDPFAEPVIETSPPPAPPRSSFFGGDEEDDEDGPDLENYDYFNSPVDRIAAIARAHDLSMPGHLAICITKFDHPLFFRWLDEQGFIAPKVDDNGVYSSPPHVPDDRAEDVFRKLAPDDLIAKVEHTFGGDKVGYFVSSVRGVEVRRDEPILRATCIDPKAQDRRRRGISPVNVLEPVLWLRESIMRDREHAAKKASRG